MILVFFFFNDTATTEIYTLSLHDALPICTTGQPKGARHVHAGFPLKAAADQLVCFDVQADDRVFWYSDRSEEHTSELQSRQYLVCRLLLEKKKITNFTT